MKTILTLSALPPSLNRIWRSSMHGTYRTAEYKAWLRDEGLLLKSQMRGQPKFIGPVYITMPMRPPGSRSDIDNRLKGVGDLLEGVGVVGNDRQIHGWHVWWSDILPKGVAAEISIVAVSIRARATAA